MKNFGWQRAALIFQPSVSGQCLRLALSNCLIARCGSCWTVCGGAAFPSHINTFMNQYNVTDIQQFAYYVSSLLSVLGCPAGVFCDE